MADENNSDISNEKTSFISPLNDNTNSLQQPNDYQHIQEIQSTKFSTEEINNHSHIQPIQNGNHHENPSNIQPFQQTENNSTETQFIEETTPIHLQSTENHPTETQFIEEATPLHEQSTSPLHIEPIHTYHQQTDEQQPSQIDQNSFDQSNTFDNDDQSNTFNNQDQSNTFNNEDQPNTVDNDDQLNTFNKQDQLNTFNNEDQPNTFNNDDQSNTFNNQDQSSTFNNEDQSNSLNNDDQSNISNKEDQSDLLLVDTSNIDTNFQTEQNLHDKPDQFKAQRELDDDEIPPAEIPIDETPINHETNNPSTNLENNITDDRPLTELETPYEHHHQNEDENENKNDSVELPTDETNLIDNHSLTQIENSHENKINNLSLSAFLPDVVTETFEQNHGDFINEPIESEKVLIEENPVNNQFNLTEEDFPPLPPPLDVVEQTIFKEEDFPPLAATSIADEEIFDKQEQKSLLSSNIESIPLKSEDLLGNKTLFKQTIVEGELNSRPTRSTMVRISYTLSLVDNLTSNVRVIENISNEKYFVSECDLIAAIDISVLSMNRGERALIDSDIRHCYGEIGSEEKQIPPVSSLNSYRMKIDLELHDWISPPDVQLLSIDERLYWGDKKRKMGNFYYRRQDYKTSLLCYNGALRFLSIDDNPILISFDESQKSILNDQYIQVQNNVAQVNLFLNKYQACLNAVENVLKYDPKNVKALMRQGKALFELGKYEQAIPPLKLFTQIQRENSNIGIDYEKANEMISVSENKLANYQKNEKEIYRRMFQSTTTTTTPTTNSTLNQQQQTKNINQIDNTNNNWWPYIALGSAALAVVGVVTFIKYRKVS